MQSGVIPEYRFEHTKVVLPIGHEVEKGIWALYAPRDLHGRKARQLISLGRVGRDLAKERREEDGLLRVPGART